MNPGRMLCTATVAVAQGVSGCGIPCKCGEPGVKRLPADQAIPISDIRIEDWYDGGASDEWAWHDAGSPWDGVLGGEVVLEGGALSVEYRTEQGTFRVQFEEVEPQGWGGAYEWSP